MKTSEKYAKAFRHFKRDYAYTMGGTQTVVLPNGKEHHFDDRQYYSGRGKKYNHSIRHDEIGVVKVSRKEYSAFLQMLREEEAARALRLQRRAEKEARLREAAERGVYNLEEAPDGDGVYVELSDEESEGRYFDAERLARTFGISVEDAELLNSGGKTYVYAKNAEGKTVNLYHPSLTWNRLSIHAEIDNGERYAEMMKDRESWENAPFAREVGQTEKRNHFVC